MRTQRQSVLLLILSLMLFVSPVWADEAEAPVEKQKPEQAFDLSGPKWKVAAGYFDVLEGSGAAQFNLEYLHKTYWQYFRPAIGVSLDNEGGLYTYAGGYAEFSILERWTFAPNFVAGAYFDGGSKSLGSVLQFRSGLEIDYNFDSGRSLGVAFNHISNASLGDKNPGAESLMLVYSWPL